MLLILNSQRVCNKIISIHDCNSRLVKSRFQGMIMFGYLERFEHGTPEKVVIQSGTVNPATCLLDSCSSWFVKAVQKLTCNSACVIVLVSVREE